MAYNTWSYTDQDDVLTDATNGFAAWAVANGWTQNNLSTDGTGYRLHISKSIGGTTRYFNFRSAVGETIPATGSTYAATRCIAVNGSTAWDGTGTTWDKQTGFTTTLYGNTVSAFGLIEDIKASGGTAHFFASSTNLTMVLETESGDNDWRMITVGATGGYSSYFTSGSRIEGFSTGVYDTQSSYCAATNAPSVTQLNHASLFVPSEGWYGMRTNATASNTRIMHNIIDSDATVLSDIYGSTALPIVRYTPDLFRGNAQLAPSLVTIKRGTASEVWPIGDIEGVKFVNMTNYADEEEITYDTDTYKMFRNFNACDQGIAFLK